jgi:hypothetical protein
VILAAGDSSAVVIAAISTGGVVVSALIAALVQINHISKKADAVQAQTGAIQVQVNGQMTAILDQLEAANEARVAAEIELARYRERDHEKPTP